MRKSSTTYDVVIVHSWDEKTSATEVAKAFRESGVRPVTDDELAEAADYSDALWEALAECQAVVVLLSERPLTASMTFQIGAAMGRSKPTYGVVTNVLARIPFVPRDIPIYPVGRLPDLIDTIRSITRQLNDDDRSFLASIYGEVGVAVDQLAPDSGPLGAIVDRFRAVRGKEIPGERLLTELMRLRKDGKLESLRKPSSKRRAPDPA